MRQEPSFITTLTIGDETREVKVYGNIDKITNFTYYTFYFNDWLIITYWYTIFAVFKVFIISSFFSCVNAAFN